MKIGELKNILEKINGDKTAYFDFCDCIPTTISSWRGIYAEPSLGWKSNQYGNHLTTVEKLLQELRLATDGRTYSGWKGGEYKFSDDDELHVDNPGQCTYTKINQVINSNEHFIVLSTEYCP